jgi:hypothetical protein
MARATRDRLVYLLDHEYTPRGLNWRRLKGADARRVTGRSNCSSASWCAACLDRGGADRARPRVPGAGEVRQEPSVTQGDTRYRTLI